MTKKQKIFLVVYPIIHLILAAFIIFHSFALGIRFLDGPFPIPWWYSAASRIEIGVLQFFWAPIDLMYYLGVPRHDIAYLDWFLVLIAGVVYAVFFLHVFVLVKKVRGHSTRS